MKVADFEFLWTLLDGLQDSADLTPEDYACVERLKDYALTEGVKRRVQAQRRRLTRGRSR